MNDLSSGTSTPAGLPHMGSLPATAIGVNPHNGTDLSPAKAPAGFDTGANQHLVQEILQADNDSSAASNTPEQHRRDLNAWELRLKTWEKTLRKREQALKIQEQQFKKCRNAAQKQPA